MFLGTSVMAAIGVWFSMQRRSDMSFLRGAYALEVFLYWYLMGWLALSAIALVLKLIHWKDYAEWSPFRKKPLVTVVRWLSYGVWAATATLFVDRAVMGFLSVTSAALAQDKNPSDFLSSIVYMVDKSYGIILQGILTTVGLSVFGTLIAFVLFALIISRRSRIAA